MIPVTSEIKELSHQIFIIDPRITQVILINVDGRVLLDQSSSYSEPTTPSLERAYYYYQMELRRKKREFFNEFYGNTEYIHILRDKIQQVIVYFPTFTVFLNLEKEVEVNDINKIVQKIKNLDEKIINMAINSPFFRIAS